MAYVHRLALALALVWGTTGCGDDDGPATPIDSGTESDAAVAMDAAGEDAGPEEDGGPVGDGAVADGGGGMDGAVADGGDTDAGGDTDGGPPVPSVTANDQTLTDLSTIVVVAEVVATGAGWIVIHEDDGGAAGPAIGHAAVTAGTNTNVSVTLDRPAVDETLHAMLHTDAGTVGTYEFPGADGPVMSGGAAVMDPFDVTVMDGTPAIRINVSASGMTDYQVDSVEPAAYRADVIGTSGATLDPELSLNSGWRYEIANSARAAHPFEIVNASAIDIVLLSQATATTGTLEGDGSVDWNEAGDSIFFTVSATFNAQANGYRCFFHQTMMRGNITVP